MTIRSDYFFLPFAQITDSDDASVTGHTGTISYYSYVMPGEYWIIQAWDTVAGSFRYYAGYKNYTNNWTNRKSLSYDYLYNILT